MNAPYSHISSEQTDTATVSLADTKDVKVFASIDDLLSSYRGDDPVSVLFPARLVKTARRFLDGFTGRTLYAVKANPHPIVLETLWAAGVHSFDVASIREIDLVRTLLPEAQQFLMNPVKSRETIRHAFKIGIRDFSFDSRDELLKILCETGNADDLNLHVRICVPQGGAMMPLTGKFGADFEEAWALLKEARPVARKLGICFHVGSQCMDPKDYSAAIDYCARLIGKSGVKLDSLDCGGGFPVPYPGSTPPETEAYFKAIDHALVQNGLDTVELLGEPGRFLCAEGGSTIARIDLKKGADLYLNDGAYGSLFDAARFAWKYPVNAHRLSGEALSSRTSRFRVFGPTCDSADVLSDTIALPENICEGDWIAFGNLGAYGQAMTTQFNGFGSSVTALVLG